MPLWLALAISLSLLAVLFAFLLRIRYRVEWDGGSVWSASLQFGIPGFMRGLRIPATVVASATPVSDSRGTQKGQEGFLRLPRLLRFDKNRWRRALFRLATDGLFLKALAVFSRRSLISAWNLLNLSVEMDLSLRDPDALGKVAGAWYALGSFPVANRFRLRCDFERQNFHWRVVAGGGFSAARMLLFAARTLGRFPWVMVARRAWYCWSNPDLSGWRAFAYGRIQAL